MEPENSSSPVVQTHQLGEKKLQFNIDDEEQDKNVELVKNPGRIKRSAKISRCCFDKLRPDLPELKLCTVRSRRNDGFIYINSTNFVDL